jgi:hypothetical protein
MRRRRRRILQVHLGLALIWKLRWWWRRTLQMHHGFSGIRESSWRSRRRRLHLVRGQQCRFGLRRHGHLVPPNHAGLRHGSIRGKGRGRSVGPAIRSRRTMPSKHIGRRWRRRIIRGRVVVRYLWLFRLVVLRRARGEMKPVMTSPRSGRRTRIGIIGRQREWRRLDRRFDIIDRSDRLGLRLRRHEHQAQQDHEQTVPQRANDKDPERHAARGSRLLRICSQ